MGGTLGFQGQQENKFPMPFIFVSIEMASKKDGPPNGAGMPVLFNSQINGKSLLSGSIEMILCFSTTATG